MALLTSAALKNGFQGPRFARCFSLATRSLLPLLPEQQRHLRRPALHGTARPAHRRGFVSRHDSIPDASAVDLSKFVDVSEPVELDAVRPLPADGKHVAIVGGGLTGLTAAYYMASNVGPSTKITLYEANSRLGGWIKTDKVPVDVGGKKGIVNFERGPRSLSSLTTNTARFDDLVFYDLCIRLGLRPQVAPNLPRYLFYPDHLVPVPTSMAGFISDFTKEELWWKTIPGAAFGYLRHMLAGRPPMPKEPSITEFIEHVFGSSTLADNMVSGMIHGIYGGDIDKLSAPAALYPMYQRFWHRDGMNFDILTTNLDVRTLACFLGDPAVRKMAKNVADKKGALLHFGSQGLQALPDALEESLRAQPNLDIKTSTPLQKIEYSPATKKITVTQKSGAAKEFDKVYTTIGAQDLRALVPGKLSSLDKFETVSIMAVNFWFPEPNLKPPGFGYLIPRAVSQELNPDHALGVFFDSDIGNNHPEEPEGTKLFVLMGGHHYKKPGVKIPTPEEAIQQARGLLERHLGIPANLPCHAEANLSRNCIPQHNVGHGDVTERLAAELEEQFEGRLFPTGGSFTRIGGMAALRDGWLAGTLGLDPSKPIYHDYLKDGWEGMLGPMWTEMNSGAPMYHEIVSSVRTARYPPEKQHVLRALMSPESRHTIFKSPNAGK